MEAKRLAIAIISVEDWAKIHAFASEHDIAHGQTEWHCFDARGGGAINVWTIDERDPQRMGEVRGTFLPDRSDGKPIGALIEDVLAGRTDPATLLVPGFVAGQAGVIIRFWPGVDPTPERQRPYREEERRASWSQAEAEQFFDRLYLHVLGRPLSSASLGTEDGQ